MQTHFFQSMVSLKDPSTYWFTMYSTEIVIKSRYFKVRDGHFFRLFDCCDSEPTKRNVQVNLTGPLKYSAKSKIALVRDNEYKIIAIRSDVWIVNGRHSRLLTKKWIKSILEIVRKWRHSFWKLFLLPFERVTSSMDDPILTSKNAICA